MDLGTPPLRRKSCGACVRAKRRCDLGRPACARCSQLHIRCRYSGPSTALSARGNSRPEGASSKGSESSIASELLDGSQDLIRASSYEICPDLLEPDGFVAQTNGITLPVSGDSTRNSVETFFGPDGLNTLGMAASAVFDLGGSTTFSSELALNTSISPSLLSAPKTKPAPDDFASIVSKRLQYTMDELARAPGRMVYDNGTPWCHKSLYGDEMPRSMQDAQACCALYLSKKSTNTSSIVRTIEARAQDVADGSLPPAPRLLDVLARTHALLLYQIMRVFDNDLTLHAYTAGGVDTVSVPLETAVLQLQDHLHRHPPRSAPAELPLYPLSTARAFWTSWVQYESARRTVVVASVVAQLYRRIRGLAGAVPCDAALWWCKWTASARLWEAEDAADFCLAWRRGKREPVTVAEFLDALAEAEADDIDVYGRMLLTPLLGIDEAKGWFLSQGGVL